MMRSGECLAQTMLVRRISESGFGLWPTPKASAAGPDFAKLDRSATGISLATAVALWPTPAASDSKGSVSLARVNHRAVMHSRGVRLPEHVSKLMQMEVGGSLNPPWVEWLMGWPLGWTALKPLETGKFRLWLRSHGESFQTK
jgi:hypothetical protein